MAWYNHSSQLPTVTTWTTAVETKDGNIFFSNQGVWVSRYNDITVHTAYCIRNLKSCAGELCGRIENLTNRNEEKFCFPEAGLMRAERTKSINLIPRVM